MAKKWKVPSQIPLRRLTPQRDCTTYMYSAENTENNSIGEPNLTYFRQIRRAPKINRPGYGGMSPTKMNTWSTIINEQLNLKNATDLLMLLILVTNCHKRQLMEVVFQW